MADEYTPTTEEVREDFAFPWEGFKQDKKGRLAAFDRWLAAHDRAVRAEALGEAAGALDAADVGADAVFWTDEGYESVTYWLRARADEMEKEVGA